MVERDYFSHQILDCGSANVFTVMQSNGIDYRSAGENVGWSGGITDPVQAAIYQNTLYMNSSPHRANILDSAYTQVGVGSWDTAPGQTWSGGGGAPVADVVVSAVEFIQSGSSVTAEVPAIATSWQPAASLGAAPVGTPHAASWGVGDTDVFWRGSDGGLWHEWYSNGWQGPQELSPSGTMASDPYPVSWGPGNLEVFWRGTDGNLWQVDYINGWQGPADLGFGPLDFDPHPVSWVSATSTSSGKGPTEGSGTPTTRTAGTVLSRWATRSRLPPIPTRSPGAPGTSTSSGPRLPAT